MKRKTFTKRILAVALSIIMVMSIMPIQAFAISYDTYDVSYRTQSEDNPAWIRYGLTDSSAGNFSIVDQGSTVEFMLSLDNGWYLEKWNTWFKGGEDKALASDPSYDESNPVLGRTYTFTNTYQSGQLTNEKYIFVSNLRSLYGDFRIDAVVRPILTVNAGDGISYQISTNNPLTTELSSNQVAVVYGNDATVTYSVDNKYVVTDVSANYNTNYSENGTVVTVNSITKPATVTISTKLKQQNVIFNANGGEGTMSAQVFEHSVAQTLTENNFTKTGYTFAGWNTKADGTGTAYTDKQSVTFTPVNDGESITLYAQWTACTNHQWEDGECTECGTLCSHSGGNATCSEQATCSECSMKYGDLGKHKHVYNASENIITETCENNCGHNATATITAPTGELVYDGTEKNATVSYSDGWQGGVLMVIYSDGGNIDAGKVTASIEKDGVKASVDYTIDKINPNYTVPTGLTATYGQTLASIVLPEGWTWDDPTASVGDTGTNSFEAIFTPANTTNYNTVSEDMDVTVDKAVITITVDNKTAKQYEGLPQFTFTVTGLIQGETLIANPTISTQADMKSAGTFEIIATGADAGDNYTITYVPGTLTVESHTEHSGGTATCTEKAICSFCNQPYSETLPHTYSTDWKHDDTNHWHECSCGAKTDVAAHFGGTATCTAKAVCTACGSSYGEVDANAHNWGGWVSNGDGTHTRTCQTDTSHTDTDDCTGGTATCTEKAKCSVCGTAYGETLPHTYNTDWKHDGTNHWHECSCGAKAEVAVHSGGAATCKDKAVCSVCGTSYGELAAHTYENGKCTVCKAEDPNYVPETSSPQTGDNSHMALWIALLFISGGAIISLTVYDRKRRTASNR